jgi:uncharacterized protein (TIGR03437 family)
MLFPPGNYMKWKERNTVKTLLRSSCFVLTFCVLGLSLTESNVGSAQTREIRVVSSNAAPGQTINLSIVLVAQGNENAVGFSLNFNQSIFSNPVVTLGSGATGALLNANTNQASEGRIGIVLALPAGQTFTAGVRQIVSIAFNIAANAPAGPAAITFSDLPVVREVSDANAGTLTTTFTNGAVTISQQTAQITINPPNPTTTDNITIQLSGVWPDSCVPQNPQLSVTGADLRIDTSNPGQACLTVLTNWSLNVPAGILPAGNYTVRVIHTANSAQQNLGQSNFTVTASPVVSVSAASFIGNEIATESIIAAFGVNLATGVGSATMLPLPTTLAGTKVMVKDSAGVEQPAQLFFVAPSQVNYLMPSNIAPGIATVMVTSSDNKISIGAPRVTNVAPGLFSANANGQGVAAAIALRVKQNGDQVFESISRFDSTQTRFVTVPIDLGPEGEQVFLLLFGTGFRFRSSLAMVDVKIGGIDCEILYAGPSPDFVGLDQVNVRLPRSLAGRGEVDLVMTVDGKIANAMKVNVK